MFKMTHLSDRSISSLFDIWFVKNNNKKGAYLIHIHQLVLRRKAKSPNLARYYCCASATFKWGQIDCIAAGTLLPLSFVPSVVHILYRRYAPNGWVRIMLDKKRVGCCCNTLKKGTHGKKYKQTQARELFETPYLLSNVNLLLLLSVPFFFVLFVSYRSFSFPFFPRSLSLSY